MPAVVITLLIIFAIVVFYLSKALLKKTQLINFYTELLYGIRPFRFGTMFFMILSWLAIMQSVPICISGISSITNYSTSSYSLINHYLPSMITLVVVTFVSPLLLLLGTMLKVASKTNKTVALKLFIYSFCWANLILFLILSVVGIIACLIQRADNANKPRTITVQRDPYDYSLS